MYTWFFIKYDLKTLFTLFVLGVNSLKLGDFDMYQIYPIYVMVVHFSNLGFHDVKFGHNMTDEARIGGRVGAAGGIGRSGHGGGDPAMVIASEKRRPSCA